MTQKETPRKTKSSSMDNTTIRHVADNFNLLKFTFGGVWSANNFPIIAKRSALFQIINTSPSYMRGTHWILIVAFHSIFAGTTIFVDFYERVHNIFSNRETYTIHEIASSPHPQSQSSNLCGMYCLYTALKFFEKIGYAHYNNSKDCKSVMKQFRYLVESAVKNIGLINEVNLIQFFNSRLQSKHTYKIL